MNAQEDMQVVEAAAEHAINQEMALEEMEFAQLFASSQPAIITAKRVTRPSVEEQEMWDNHAASNEGFDAGIDREVAIMAERERLEREATDFALWNVADYLPDEVQNDSALLLDEIEQEDILSEILRNARKFPLKFNFCSELRSYY